MPLIEVEMLIGRNTTAGFKNIGEVVSLPEREADRYVSRGQAKLTGDSETVSVEEGELSETVADDD